MSSNSPTIKTKPKKFIIKKKKFNIEDTFDEIKKYIDNTLNKDRTLFKTSNDEPTPLDCCEEILSKIPSELWSKNNLKILDPCAGYGNFEIILHNFLREHKSTKDILE